MIILRRTLSSIAKPSQVRFPKLAVFDLDHTLWNFGVDSFCFTPPFHVDKSTGKLIDMSAKSIECFPDTPKVLKYFQSLSVPVAVASRTKYIYGANILLEMLNLKQYINYYEIYPGKKIKHFFRIQAESGVPFSDMIFFDDEIRNIVDISALGVHSVLVDRDTGATEAVVKEAIAKFTLQTNNGN